MTIQQAAWGNGPLLSPLAVKVTGTCTRNCGYFGTFLCVFGPAEPVCVVVLSSVTGTLITLTYFCHFFGNHSQQADNLKNRSRAVTHWTVQWVCVWAGIVTFPGRHHRPAVFVLWNLRISLQVACRLDCADWFPAASPGGTQSNPAVRGGRWPISSAAHRTGGPAGIPLPTPSGSRSKLIQIHSVSIQNQIQKNCNDALMQKHKTSCWKDDSVRVINLSWKRKWKKKLADFVHFHDFDD